MQRVSDRNSYSSLVHNIVNNTATAKRKHMERNPGIPLSLSSLHKNSSKAALNAFFDAALKAAAASWQAISQMVRACAVTQPILHNPWYGSTKHDVCSQKDLPRTVKNVPFLACWERSCPAHARCLEQRTRSQAVISSAACEPSPTLSKPCMTFCGPLVVLAAFCPECLQKLTGFAARKPDCQGSSSQLSRLNHPSAAPLSP